MLFRAADSERKNLILLDEFRIFLGKIKLNLSDPEINKIIQIIDDDCSETLKKSSYY
jgi:Ca2+-binding EF-hand superfamily protein